MDEYDFLYDTRSLKKFDFKNKEAYISIKLRMLERDFGIRPTQKELDRLDEVNTEVAIDNVIHSIFEHHLGR